MVFNLVGVRWLSIEMNNTLVYGLGREVQGKMVDVADENLRTKPNGFVFKINLISLIQDASGIYTFYTR